MDLSESTKHSTDYTSTNGRRLKYISQLKEILDRIELWRINQSIRRKKNFDIFSDLLNDNGNLSLFSAQYNLDTKSKNEKQQNHLHD